MPSPNEEGAGEAPKILNNMATKEYFPGIGKIKFEGKDSKNPMAFRYYDAEKVINGRKMKDWLKFAMAWWHTLCAEGGDQFGG